MLLPLINYSLLSTVVATVVPFSGVIQLGTMVIFTISSMLVPCSECHQGLALSEEKRLIKQLIDNYTIDGKYGRPIKMMNATLRVGYGISLVQIMDVDEKDQVLTTNVWCKYAWRDESLHWNPEEHDNITIVRVPIDAIWKPDFVLYNYADERLSEHRHAMALIDPNGEVTYIPPAIFKSTCFIDTTNFPFDEQNCHMKFGSWTYNGNALDPYFINDKAYIELSEYVPSQEWIILEHWAQKNVLLYDCCPNEPYPDLTFYLKLRRRATFYSYTLILPCVLLSFITMVLFMLPPETPAKMLLGINIFVAFFLLMVLLKDSTPPTAKQIPIIGAYYCFNMVMTTISTFLCSILVDMHYRADKRNPPSRWLTFLIIQVATKAMFMHVPDIMVRLKNSQKLEKKIERKKAWIRRQNYSGFKLVGSSWCECIMVKRRKSKKVSEVLLNKSNAQDPVEMTNFSLCDQVCQIHGDNADSLSSTSPSSYKTVPQFISSRRESEESDHCGPVTSCLDQTSKDTTKLKASGRSLTKTGVFVGATTSSSNQGSPDKRMRSPDLNVKKREQESKGKTRQMKRMLPSSSFDLKHHNKFSAANSPVTSPGISPTIEPTLRRFENRITAIAENAVRVAQRNYSIGSDNSSFETAITMPAITAESEIQFIRTILQEFIVKISEKEIRKMHAEAWRMISMVFDRIFLLGYIVSMILSLTTLFPNRPPELEDGQRFPNGSMIGAMADHHMYS